MNDLYFTGKNKKARKDENSPSKPLFFAKKPIKRSKSPHFGNKKAIIPIFFVSILWFLYGWDRWIRTIEMPESKSGALPLGYIPIFTTDELYHKKSFVSIHFW